MSEQGIYLLMDFTYVVAAFWSATVLSIIFSDVLGTDLGKVFSCQEHSATDKDHTAQSNRAACRASGIGPVIPHEANARS